MKKLQIQSIFGELLFESKADDIKEVLIKAVKDRANLVRANLRETKSLPQSYINLCSRDMLFIFMCLKNELPGLRKALVEGRVDGSQYEGECACLIGTLAKVDGGMKKVCAAIPYYEKGLHNYGEQWFWQIRKGDKPDTNFFAEHAVKLIDSILGKKTKKNLKPKI